MTTKDETEKSYSGVYPTDEIHTELLHYTPKNTPDHTTYCSQTHTPHTTYSAMKCDFCTLHSDTYNSPRKIFSFTLTGREYKNEFPIEVNICEYCLEQIAHEYETIIQRVKQ